MISDFDIHAPSGRVVIRHVLQDGSVCAHIYDVASHESMAEIDSWYMPQGLRFSPDGTKISFFGDSSLYVYDVETRAVRRIFDDPVFENKIQVGEAGKH